METKSLEININLFGFWRLLYLLSNERVHIHHRTVNVFVWYVADTVVSVGSPKYARFLDLVEIHLHIFELKTWDFLCLQFIRLLSWSLIIIQLSLLNWTSFVIELFLIPFDWLIIRFDSFSLSGPRWLWLQIRMLLIITSRGVFIDWFHGCVGFNLFDSIILFLVYGFVFLSILNRHLHLFLWIAPRLFLLIRHTFHRLYIIHNGLYLKNLNLIHILIHHRRPLLILRHLRLSVHFLLYISPTQLRLSLLVRVQLGDQLTEQLSVFVNHHPLWILLSVKSHLWTVLIR